MAPASFPGVPNLRSTLGLRRCAPWPARCSAPQYGRGPAAQEDHQGDAGAAARHHAIGPSPPAAADPPGASLPRCLQETQRLLSEPVPGISAAPSEENLVSPTAACAPRGGRRRAAAALESPAARHCVGRLVSTSSSMHVILVQSS